MIAHISKRIAFVMLGYFAGLAAGAVVFPGIVFFMAHFKPESNLWQLLGLGPIAVIVAPVILFSIMWIVMIFTAIPAAILKLLTEVLALRQLWLHLLISLLLAAYAGLMLVPDWFLDMNSDRWLITLVIALSALVGGLVYWAIAGRMAGFCWPEFGAHAPGAIGAAAGNRENNLRNRE